MRSKSDALLRIGLSPGPYEFDADPSRLEAHHVLARTLPEQLRQKLDADVCSSAEDLGELV